MTINFVLCQVRLILFSTNLITISFMKTILKTLKITANFVKSPYEHKKTFWRALPIFFSGGTLCRIPLRPGLISIELQFVYLIVKERELWCSKRNNHRMPPHAYLVSGMRLFTRLQPLNFMTRCPIVARPYFSYAEACTCCLFHRYKVLKHINLESSELLIC